MATQPPLDEIVYQRPDIIEWWLSMGGRPMDENMIYRYISESPFFDYMSNNGLPIDQSRTDQRAFDMTCSRRMFDDHLKSKRGTEFMIVGEPQSTDGSGAGVPGGVGGNGMWVIRKQNREHAGRKPDGRMDEELTTLGTYYLIGENMYQAPAVGDILGNRLISAANSLSKFFDTAADLPDFSPAKGYTYPAATVTNQPTAAGATSANASPSRSREGSVAAGETQSLRSTSVLPDASSQQQSSNTAQHAALLARSFTMAREFGDEYMDENPLIGEPGNFSFTHSTQAVKKRRADEEAAAAKLKEEKDAAASRVVTTAAAGKAAAVPSPPAVMTESKASATTGGKSGEKEGKRVGKMDKARRKKSRGANSLAPTTPGGGASSTPTNGGGG